MNETRFIHQKQSLPGTPVVGFPINRKRSPMGKASKTNMSDKEHAKRQREAAEQREKAEKGFVESDANPFFNTTPTDTVHTGDHPDDKSKAREIAPTGDEVQTVKSAPTPRAPASKPIADAQHAPAKPSKAKTVKSDKAKSNK